MRRTLLTAVLAALVSCNFCFAQTVTFSESFIYNSTNRCAEWTTFQNAITPGIYTEIRMSGTYDPVGLSCTDPVIVNAMATAIKTSAAYISPSSGGHVWSVCNRYQAEVWIDPPTLCSGSNCPLPGYLMRPCFGASNFGGVNTATCSTIPNQTMTLTLVAPPPCAQPTNVTASNITITSATLSWAPVPSSAGYDYVVDQNPGNPVGGGTYTSNTSVYINNLSINATYYFHVRNECNATLHSYWTTIPFTTLDAYCKPPVQLLFSNITGASADVHWSLMPTADWYQYHLDITKNAQPTSANSLTTTGITAQFTNLTPNTWYYLYVRSFCTGGEDSSLWKIDSFYTNMNCPAPNVTISNASSSTPEANWPAVPNAFAYEYIVTNSSATPNFGAQITSTSVTLNLPSDNKAQYLHVRTKCNSMFSFSNWSTTQLRATSVNDVVQAPPFKLYPNPANDVITIEKDEEARGSKLLLTDITGKVLQSRDIKGKKLDLNLGQLSPGLYLIKIEDENGSAVAKFNKL